MFYPWNSFKLKLVGSLSAITCVGQVYGADLMDVYRLAKDHDATILAARASAKAGQERVPQAKAQLFPSISVSMTRYQNDLTNSQPNFFGQLQTSDLNYRSGNDTVTLRQPLYRPGTWRQYEQAQSQGDEALANVALEEQNLIVRVIGAYLDALIAKDQLNAILAQQELIRAQLDAANKFLRSGTGTRTDIDEAQARLDMSAANEIEARQQIDYSLRQLESMLSVSIDSLAPLNVQLFKVDSPDPSELEVWTAKALEQSPQLSVLSAQFRQAQLEVEKNRAGHLPTLDAVVQWSRSESENVNNVTSRYTNGSAGVQLSIPLYNGGYVNSAVRQASFNLDRAQQALDFGRKDLRLKVQREFRSILENAAKIKALEQAMRSADLAVQSSQRSLEGGSRTVLDVLNAGQHRKTVLRDLMQARFFYLMSKVRLCALAGGATEQTVSETNAYFQPN